MAVHTMRPHEVQRKIIRQGIVLGYIDNRGSEHWYVTQLFMTVFNEAVSLLDDTTINGLLTSLLPTECNGQTLREFIAAACSTNTHEEERVAAQDRLLAPLHNTSHPLRVTLGLLALVFYLRHFKRRFIPNDKP